MCRETWPVYAGKDSVGRVTSAVWSPDCNTNVAMGMIEASHRDTGTAVEVRAPDGHRAATVCGLPHGRESAPQEGLAVEILPRAGVPRHSRAPERPIVLS